MSDNAIFSRSENPLLGTITEFASRYGSTALKFYLLSVARSLNSNGRLAVCYRYKLPDRDTIDLVVYPDASGEKRPGVVGTMKCGLLWQCPVCASRIAMQRRKELREALDNHREYVRLLVTYTASHHKNMRLKSTLDALLTSFRRLRSGRWWQTIKSEFGLIGSIRATEITYGDNGWHPHFHELLLVNPAEISAGNISLEELQESIQTLFGARWQYVLAEHGITASDERGINVSTKNGDIAAYVNKYGRMPVEREMWGDSGELALAAVKTARSASRTPFEILFDAAGDPASAGLWAEYLDATKGRAALVWSRGTKALLGIDELPDDLCPDEAETREAIILQSFTPEEWRYLDKKGAIPSLIAVAAWGDYAQVARVAAAAKRAIANGDSDRCHVHGVPLKPGETCPVCDWNSIPHG